MSVKGKAGRPVSKLRKGKSTTLEFKVSGALPHGRLVSLRGLAGQDEISEISGVGNER